MFACSTAACLFLLLDDMGAMLRCSWLSVVDQWPIFHVLSGRECSVVDMAEVGTFFVHYLALDLHHQLWSTP